MPPKRRPKSEESSSPPPVTTATISNSQSASASIDEPDSKKPKINEADSLIISSVPPTAVTSSQNDEEEDDDIPECRYGATCYRKNPQHFKEFRHPGDNHSAKKPKSTSNTTSTTTSAKKVVDDSPTKDTASSISSSVPSDLLQSYSSILQLTLAKNKISADEKRLLRQYRKKHNIADSDHFKLLKNFGWSEDEYDDGVKVDDEIELDEEHKVLEKDDGFEIIRITKADTHKSKNHMNVFSKVCTKFYETMSKAQANYTVTEVGVVVNSQLKKSYTAKKLELQQEHGEDVKEEWGFHGSSRDSILKISRTGFLMPDELKALQSGSSKGKKKKSKPKHEKPVELLDDGYYGKGVYFTTFSDYALWYSSERESDQVLLCKLLAGKSYKCTKRMDGQGCQYGYNSHISPKGNEIVMFDKAQILPRYVITFVEKEAEEREQES